MSKEGNVMIRTPRLLVGLLALGLLIPAVSFAADAAAKGTIKGKVTTADGKAAAGVTVRVVAPTPKAAPAADQKPDASKTAADETPAKGKGKKAAANAVATATADTDGNYSVEVPAGDYTVTVADKVLGAGRAKVTVKAGETATADITLKESKKAK